MNFFDSILELDDHHEDFIGLHEPSFDIDPMWCWELDLEYMQGEV